MNKKQSLASGMFFGLGLGCLIGLLLDNPGPWIAIGLAFGAGLGGRHSKQKNN